LAVALIDEGVNFTKIKQVLDYLFRMLGVEYKIEEVEDGNYITGRVGRVVVDGKSIGLVGEIAPRVLRNWRLGFPVGGFEVGLGWLLDI